MTHSSKGGPQQAVLRLPLQQSPHIARGPPRKGHLQVGYTAVPPTKIDADITHLKILKLNE